MSYIFTEPSPSTATYIRSGRGGAGNTFRASDLPSASTSTSTSTSSSFTPRRFFSGIGGAGNAHEADQLRPALLRSLEGPGDRREQNPAVGYCGRGGAGNVYRRKTSDAASVSSEGSEASSVRSSVGAKAKLWAARVSGSSFGRE